MYSYSYFFLFADTDVCRLVTLYVLDIQDGFIQKRRQKSSLAILHQDELKNRLICTLFFNSSWCKSANSSTRPGANQPILQLVLVQISLFFNSSWYKSAYSSNRPVVYQPILQIVLVQIRQFFKSYWCKTACGARNWINSVPQEAATTFAFSSV